MMVISKVGDKWISTDKIETEIDLYKLIYNIKKYKITSAKYIGSDLEILVQENIYINGKSNKKNKKILFKDYLNNKDYFNYLNFNDDIESKIDNSTNKNNKSRNLIVYPVALTLLASGIKVMAYNQLFKYIDDSSDNKDNINNSIIVNNLIKKYNDETVDFPNLLTNDNPNMITNEQNDKDVNLIYNMLKKYCDYYNFDEELISKIYSDNYIDISNSNNKEETIMRLVYEYYTDNLYLDLYIEPNNLTEDEMEMYIVKFAKVLGINNEEILYTMLSIHELETGHGTSKLCLEKNNMGGIMFVNPDTGEFEFQHYPNAVAGALGFVINFDRIYKATIPVEYQDYNFDWNKIDDSIEYYMKPMYCNEPMNEGDPEWDELVCDLKATLKQNNRLIDIYQTINDLDNNMYRSR